MIGTTRGLLALLLCVLLAAACSAGTSQPFSFENATAEPVTVRVNDRLRLLLQPGETKSFNTPNNKGARRVVATDEKGVTRIDKVYTWDELEAVDFRLVIR
ncbi:MAG TPA: hypothetical protein VJB57_03740 [Dehalococcoidia bacterium]|nr:hypothetical protein [Dehalococcoidia bacterium]